MAQDRRSRRPARRSAPVRRPTRSVPGPDQPRTDPGTSAGTVDRAFLAEIRNAARPGRSKGAQDALEAAVAALDHDDPPAAAEAALAAKRLAPRSASAREVLGIALYRQGRYREAASELLAYRRMTGRPDQNHLIADAYRALGTPEKGIPLVQEELAAAIPAEARAEAAVIGAAALADMGRLSEALATLRLFPTRDDVGAHHDLRVWYVQADVLQRAGRPTEALELLRLIHRHDPDAFDVEDRMRELDRSAHAD